jgi:hypothetical protein
LYFTAEREPVWWVAAALAIGAIAVAAFTRTRASFPVALGCAAIAAGFATGAIKARIVEHTVLRTTAYSVGVSGFVETREERERSDRIVLRVTTMEGARLHSLAMIEAAAPKDEIEGALAVQMACTHTTAMAVLAKLDVGFASERRVAAFGSAAARLLRAYATQVEVLRRLRLRAARRSSTGPVR